MNINTISASDPRSNDLFPEKLRHIPMPPQQLFIRGELPPASRKHVAIIGTRRPTKYGIEITLQLAERLAERGVVIVSGLALGVDALAHQGALKARGATVAVLAGGVDNPTPFTNARLADQILDEGGAIISEYPAGMPAMSHQFLERNRLVAGLADAVIVTEASARSGTSNTVSHALQQGKDVYAVPGPITSPMSAGCNSMIAQGASPIISVEDFVEQFMPSENIQQEIFSYDEHEQAIVSLLKTGLRDGDELQQKSQLEAGQFATTMTMLEMRGAIRPLGANQWSL